MASFFCLTSVGTQLCEQMHQTVTHSMWNWCNVEITECHVRKNTPGMAGCCPTWHYFRSYRYCRLSLSETGAVVWTQKSQYPLGNLQQLSTRETQYCYQGRYKKTMEGVEKVSCRRDEKKSKGMPVRDSKDVICSVGLEQQTTIDNVFLRILLLQDKRMRLILVTLRQLHLQRAFAKNSF